MGRTLEEFKERHDPTHNVGEVNTVYDRPFHEGTTRFIITAAQNATPVDERWWAVLENMARCKKAELLVIPIRYKNPTSQWSGSQRNEEYWAEEVRPYLWNKRLELNKNLTVLGDFKIQPTASSPLTGSDALSLASSGIIGHTKLQMKTVPTPSNRMAKILTTTGACTVPNYTDSRAGRIGEFHHSLSAIIVEIDGSKFYLTQLHFDKKTGTCIDRGIRYGTDGFEQAPRALAIIMGDTHVRFIDEGVHLATWGEGGMIEVLRPRYLIWHDVHDGYSCNPHHTGNPFNAIAKLQGGFDNVKGEVDEAIQFIKDHTPPDCRSVVVASNHDDFLRRWILTNDWKKDPENADFYLDTALSMVRQTRLGPGGTEYPSPFILWLKRAALSNVTALHGDESFVLGGVELGTHGDIGPNGARGSIKNLRRIGIRSFIGHSHAPGIDEGCYQVGTSTVLRLEYNHGASGWLNCHGVLNDDEKRQLIIIIDGKWRA